MITALFFSDGSLLTGFRVQGHAGAAPRGKDIVCAAVSSAVYCTVNTLTDAMGLSASLRESDGVLSCFLTRSCAEQAQAVLKGLKLHLNALSEQYPNFLKVKGRGVTNAEDKHPAVRP